MQLLPKGQVLTVGTSRSISAGDGQSKVLPVHQAVIAIIIKCSIFQATEFD